MNIPEQYTTIKELKTDFTLKTDLNPNTDSIPKTVSPGKNGTTKHDSDSILKSCSTEDDDDIIESKSVLSRDASQINKIMADGGVTVGENMPDTIKIDRELLLDCHKKLITYTADISRAVNNKIGSKQNERKGLKEQSQHTEQSQQSESVQTGLVL